ncbi:hypothetical protein ACQ4LE_001854 [Meloidogyne hapla]
MAIFYQLTSALLIISMAFIAINEGMMGNRSGSTGTASTGCTTHYGRLEHVDNMENLKKREFIPNVKNATNTLEVSGGETFKIKKVALVADNKVLCQTETNNSGGCGNVDTALTGSLKFYIGENIVVEVPFINAYFFTGNKCVILLKDYNIDTHVTMLAINGVNFKITPTDTKTVPKACTITM